MGPGGSGRLRLPISSAPPVTVKVKLPGFATDAEAGTVTPSAPPMARHPTVSIPASLLLDVLRIVCLSSFQFPRR
jgi:hypothetical protein